MLPFLKNRDDGIGSGPVESKQMKTSDGDEGFGAVDAIAEDMLAAFKAGDKALLKAALGALCDYVREEDIEQDEELT